jgi:hypothetical protein
MIVFTRAQMALFAAEQRARFVARMCAYLRDQFQDELWALTSQELQRRVEAALARADELGLHTERDCCRYLNLAVLYGWDFERREATAFMGAMLRDPAVGSPGRRLQRLVEECMHREAIAHGRNGPAPARTDGGIDADLLLPDKD